MKAEPKTDPKADPKGSEAAMPAAQQAAIGAKICTTSAISTIGRNFCSRRRITNPPASGISDRDELVEIGVSGFRDREIETANLISAAAKNNRLHRGLLRLLLPLPHYLTLTTAAVPFWPNSNHFAACSNFGQSLPKMMTR